jgi:ribosomal protein S21
VVADGEPIALALRRLKRHMAASRAVVPLHKRHFIRNTGIRRAKEFRKRRLAKLETWRAKREGRQ